MTKTDLRLLPSVDLVVRAFFEVSTPAAGGGTSPRGGGGPSRSEVAAAARDALGELRPGLAAGGGPTGAVAPLSAVTREHLLDLAVAGTRQALTRRGRPSLRRVINATGVPLHTNLGRARLAPEAAQAAAMAGGHVNLELSLDDGSRLSRQSHLQSLLTALTGAQDALVVNNNAAAVWLCLRNLARGRPVVISRGELVEIGESFRLPDIMAEAGVSLIEVGTTNRTTIEDYRRALAPRPRRRGPASAPPEEGRPAAIVLVHPSNYRVVGFASRPPRREIVALAREAGIPVVEDIGSGAIFDLAPWGLPGEPTPAQALAEGVDLVTFSGDKLLGGPQAGIIAGRSDLVAELRADPVLRCLRPDKLTVAALGATLKLYGDPTADPGPALARVPVLRALTEPAEAVKHRAARTLKLVRARLRRQPGGACREGDSRDGLSLVTTTTEAGGGSLPATQLPSWAVAVSRANLSPDELWRRLASGDPPVVGRRSHDVLLLDLRSVAEEEVRELAEALAVILGSQPKGGAPK